MKRFLAEKVILPSFPRTPHLQWSTNREENDIVADDESPLISLPVNIEEKIDGASVGMTLHGGHPLIRNRDHILRKGYVKDTPAKKQFASMWNWFYETKDRWKRIIEAGPFSVYGEWLIAQHGIYYDRLPDWFVAYDVYDYESDIFLSPLISRPLLIELGFTVPTLHHQGLLKMGDDGGNIIPWADLPAEWSDEQSEGVYYKVYNDERVTHRFKQVNHNYKRGQYWDGKTLRRNKRVKS